MASIVQFTPAPSRFWPAIAAQEEADRKPSDMLMRRYEALLRLSKCLTSARPEDMVNSIAAELRSVVDFDLLDIVVSPATPSEGNPGANQSACECQSQNFSEDADEADERPAHSSGVACLPLGQEIKAQCSLPLISRSSKLGFFVVGRFDESDFSEDDVEFLAQVAGQVALSIDNSRAYRHIAHLTEKLRPASIYFEDEISTEANFEEIVGRSTALRSL